MRQDKTSLALTYHPSSSGANSGANNHRPPLNFDLSILSRCSTMKAKDKTCRYCNRPLTKIEYYGEMLVGCIECNHWGRPADKTLVMQLLEDDLEALRESARRKQG